MRRIATRSSRLPRRWSRVHRRDRKPPLSCSRQTVKAPIRGEHRLRSPPLRRSHARRGEQGRHDQQQFRRRGRGPRRVRRVQWQRIDPGRAADVRTDAHRAGDDRRRPHHRRRRHRDGGARWTICRRRGATQYRTLYDLIFARPADLFPVAVTSEMLGLVDPVYPPITIAAADQTKHILALKFLINLMAYPTSNLAASYQAALSSAQQNPAKPGDIDNAMAAFFAGTKQYQSLTIDAVTAVTTYINTFAFLWAGASSDFTSFNQSATYYLYKPGAAAPGPSSAPPNLVGKLSLQEDPNAPPPARVSDTSAVYTCTFTDPSGAT